MLKWMDPKAELQLAVETETDLFQPRALFAKMACAHPSIPETRAAGVDLLSLDGCRAIRCCAEDVEFAPVRRFLRLAKWVYKVWGVGGRVGEEWLCMAGPERFERELVYKKLGK